jgi:predicted metal-binding membrane protein
VTAGGRAASWVVLTAAAIGLWLITIDQARAMGIGPGTMDMSLAFFTAMWVAMMGAMMLPSISPGAIRVSAVATSDPSSAARALRAVVNVIGFLIPWAVYGVLFYVALLGTQHLVDASPTAAKWLGVAIFAVAGVYQLSPWKRAFLGHCREHAGDRGGSPGESFASGVRHGTWCVGCCWALMSILLAVGVMNIVAMIGLAVLIFLEKVWRRGDVAARVGGVVFLGLAVVAAVHPSILGGLVPAAMGGGMGTGM